MRKWIPAAALALGLGACAAPYGDAPLPQPRALGTGPAPAAAEAALEPGKVLTLDDCVSLALKSNRGYRIAERRALMADDRACERWTRIVPSLTLNAQYKARNNDMGSDLGSFKFVMGHRASATVNAYLLVPIYAFGRETNELDSIEARARAAHIDAGRARQELVNAVSQAYFRRLEAVKILGVVEESIGVVERQLGIARDFLRQGLVARNDVLAGEVQLTERKQDRVRAQNNVELARAALNRIIGLDADAPLEIADVLETAPWTGSYEEVLRLAVENRPDLASLREQVEAARSEWRALSAGNLPLVYGFGNYNYSTDDVLLNQQWLDGGFAVQVPLLDGAGTYARLKSKEKEIAEVVDRRDDRVDGIVVEVKQAFLAIREAAERIPLARKGVELAEENLRVVRDQYAQGLVTTADVLVEEDRLSRGRSGHTGALYAYHAAVANLACAIGGNLPESR